MAQIISLFTPLYGLNQDTHMRKVMMKQDAMESFTEILDDIQYSIKVELARKECDKEKNP